MYYVGILSYVNNDLKEDDSTLDFLLCGSIEEGDHDTGMFF